MDTNEFSRPKIPAAAYFGIFYAATVMLLGMSLLYLISSISTGTVIYCALIFATSILMLTKREPTPALLIPICLISIGNIFVMLLDVSLIVSEIEYLTLHGSDGGDLSVILLLSAIFIYSLAHIMWGIIGAAVIFSNKNNILCKLWVVAPILLGVSLITVLTVFIPYGFLFLRAGVNPTSIMLSYGAVIICIEKFFFVFFTSKWMYSHIKGK